MDEEDYSEYEDWKDGKLPKRRCEWCREYVQIGEPCDCNERF